MSPGRLGLAILLLVSPLAGLDRSAERVAQARAEDASRGCVAKVGASSVRSA
jgi:hypothetical protein